MTSAVPLRQFEEDLGKATLQGDLVGEVEQLVNQSYLEQGGSFDSDTLFLSLSQKIIERCPKPPHRTPNHPPTLSTPCDFRSFSGPCERLIRVSSSIVSQALVEASRQVRGPRHNHRPRLYRHRMQTRHADLCRIPRIGSYHIRCKLTLKLCAFFLLLSLLPFPGSDCPVAPPPPSQSVRLWG